MLSPLKVAIKVHQGAKMFPDELAQRGHGENAQSSNLSSATVLARIETVNAGAASS
jgi:hypothetical protein